MGRQISPVPIQLAASGYHVGTGHVKGHGHSRKRPRGKQVVAVEPCDDFARGKAHALVDGVRLTGVGLLYDAGDVTPVSVKDGGCSVLRCTIDDDMLYIGVSLFENGDDGLFDVLRIVVGRRDDGYARPCTAVGKRGWYGDGVLVFPESFEHNVPITCCYKTRFAMSLPWFMM